MLILVINCGSSSAKYQLFNMNFGKALAKGVIERIGQKNSGCKNHYRAIALIKEKLLSGRKPILKSVGDIIGIGHRVVHGGESFSEAVIIKKPVIKSIEKMIELAPLHNPPALSGIKACSKLFPGIRQVAVFDTAFHQSIPPHAYIYGIPFGFYKKYKIRRYGFHGTSHRFVANEAAKRLKKPLGKLKIITAHLGNGCSMTAVLNGRSVDTTMGLTPLEGLLMGTRAGDMDPAIVPFLMKKENLSVSKAEELLNKESGLLGVSGISNDMRDILCYIRKGKKRARLAYDIFTYRIRKYIGAYAAVMKGLDAVILTGGIGENMPELKRRLLGDLRPILGTKIKFLTIPTNEELLIARDTYRLIKTKK
ncbi:MAG: acetate kinase [Candidatus Omnitrophica bacterium]|nr:acetate kinase [Candidatus Omnitrophota bacterium]